jgi:hypothetical protein
MTSIMRRVMAELQEARREIARLQTELEIMRDRYEAEHADHEASIRHFDAELQRRMNRPNAAATHLSRPQVQAGELEILQIMTDRYEAEHTDHEVCPHCDGGRVYYEWGPSYLCGYCQGSGSSRGLEKDE